MKTSPAAPLLSALRASINDYLNNLTELFDEWGDPEALEATGSFEICLKYPAYDVVHSITLVQGRIAMIAILRTPGGTVQVVRRKFCQLDGSQTEE